MRRSDLSFVADMNISTSLLIINQCPSGETGPDLESFHGKTRMITCNEKGLSKSRNKALDYARGEICLLSDDDLIYRNDLEEQILHAFDGNPNCDLLFFQVEGIDKKFKNYPDRACKVGYIKSLRISSVEIAFRTSKIKEAGIRFNEIFGTGAKYASGEENIFLFHCLGKGLNMKYIPLKIADMYVGNSSWFRGFNRDYFHAKGAAFTAMSESLSNLLIFQFLVRKYILFRKELGPFCAAKLMYEGKAEYLGLLEEMDTGA